MKGFLKAALVAAGLGVVLTACGPTHGVVEDKHYQPGYWYTTTQCYGHGDKSGTLQCRPTMQYMPPTWALKLVPEDKPKDEGWRNVNEHEYDVCAITETYPECAK